MGALPFSRPGHRAKGAAFWVIGLARTMQSVLDVLAEKGLETSDAPRIYAQELERWARGECSSQRFLAAFRRASLDGDGPLWHSIITIEDALRDLRAHPTHIHQLRRCTSSLGRALESLGEESKAAQHRVQQWYMRHATAAQTDAIAAETLTLALSPSAGSQ